MTIADLDPRVVAWLGLAAAGAEIAALLFGLMSIAYGRAFGRMYDFMVGLGAILAAALAMLLFPEQRQIDDQFAIIAFGLALAGALVAAMGSAVATTESVTWFRAQLYVALGYAMLGGWLLLLNYLAVGSGMLPSRVVNLGMFAGSVMALGVAALPGIMLGAEDEATAPWISRVVARSGNLGWLILFPLRGVWLAISRL